MTEPMISCPMVFTGSGPHFTVTYSDTSTNDVTIGAGTYYFDGSNTLTDLLAIMGVQFSLACDGTWVVSTSSTGMSHRTLFTKSGGSKTVTSVTCKNTADLTSIMAGFGVTDAEATILMIGGTSGQTAYQRGGIWVPRDMLLVNDTDILRMVAISVTPSGAGIIDDYGGRTTRKVVIGPAIPAVCVKQVYANDSAYITSVSGLTVSDPNIALESWLSTLRTVVNGSIPTLRFAPDSSTPATYHDVRLTDGKYYRSVESWVGNPTTAAPLQYGCVVDFAGA